MLRIKLGRRLLAINIMAVILVLIINFILENFIRMILDLPFIQFFLDYSFIVALFLFKASTRRYSTADIKIRIEYPHCAFYRFSAKIRFNWICD